MKKTILAASLLLAGGLAFGPPAEADYTVTLTQVGSNVVATGSGTIDLSGLTFSGTLSQSAAMVPGGGVLVTGPATSTIGDTYFGITGPASFGGGGLTEASSGSGDLVGISAGAESLLVPSAYATNGPLNDTATYDGQTFASLGITPGTYTWTWGTTAEDGNFTLKVGTTAVPEPGSLALLATALIGLGALGWSRRRRA